MRVGALIVVACLGLASPAFALPEDCAEPGPAPKSPVGKGATKEQMLGARQAVLDYQHQIDAILACWDKRRDFDFDVMNQDQQKRWNEDYANINKMLEEAQIDFNTQVRAYKVANPSAPSDEKADDVSEQQVSTPKAEPVAGEPAPEAAPVLPARQAVPPKPKEAPQQTPAAAPKP